MGMEILAKKADESSRQYVRRCLLYNIVNVEIKPGERIIEKEYCDLFQVSRTPIREAILDLHKNHLIDVMPKRGTFVSYIDEERVEEVRQLRAVLEAEIAREACRKLTADDLDRLRENVIIWKYYIGRKQVRKIFELHKKFHALLYTLCGKPYWSEIVEAAAPHFDRAIVLSFQCMPASQVLADHMQLIDAIEARDEDKAYELARTHLNRYNEEKEMIKQSFPGYFQ